MRADPAGFEFGEVDFDHAVEDVAAGVFDRVVGAEVLGVGAGEAGDFGAVGAFEVGGGALVEGEDGGGRADFSAHVGHGGAPGGAHRGDARAEVLDDRAGAALDGEFVGDLEDHVFRGGPAVQRAGEADADQLGHGDAPADAGHGVDRVRAADADGDHAHAAGVGGVAVGADHHPAGEGVVFEHDLVHDAGAGLPEAGAVAGRGAAEEVVDLFVLGDGLAEVGGGVDAGLDQMVAVDGGGDEGAFEAGELELEHRHLAGDILQADAVDLQGGVVLAAGDGLVFRVGEVAEEDFFGEGEWAVDALAGDGDAGAEFGVGGLDAFEGVGFVEHGRSKPAVARGGSEGDVAVLLRG